MHFNAEGLLTSQVDRNGNTTSYAYDEAGNRIQQRDARGIITAYKIVVCPRLFTDTCSGDVWFLHASENVEHFPISIPIKSGYCKYVPPGPLRKACQVAMIANAVRKSGEYVGEALEIAVKYFDEIAAGLKEAIDPDSWCKLTPPSAGEPL